MVVDGEIYTILKGKATLQSRVYYSDLPRNPETVGNILDEINRYEHSKGKPMLSAIVVSKTTRQPSSGFYDCAETLGLWHRGENKELFWIKQLNAVFKEYGKTTKSEVKLQK